jgi:hypothetical protein
MIREAWSVIGPLLLGLLFIVPLVLIRFLIVKLFQRKPRIPVGPPGQSTSAWAKEHGLTYRSAPGGVDKRFSCLLRPLGQKLNWVCGRYHGWWIQAFHYSWQAGDFGAVIVKSDCRLNRLMIRPRRSLDTLGKAVGLMDIEFESWEFNQRFVVNARSRKWAYYVLHQKAMELLIEHGEEFSIEFNGRWAIICGESPLSVDETHRAFTVLSELLRTLPNYKTGKRRRTPRPPIPPLPRSPQ